MGLGKSIDNAEGNSTGKSFRNICRNFFSIFRRTPSKTYLPILAETFIEIFLATHLPPINFGTEFGSFGQFASEIFLREKNLLFHKLVKT